MMDLLDAIVATIDCDDLDFLDDDFFPDVDEDFAPDLVMMIGCTSPTDDASEDRTTDETLMGEESNNFKGEGNDVAENPDRRSENKSIADDDDDDDATTNDETNDGSTSSFFDKMDDLVVLERVDDDLVAISVPMELFLT